MVKQTGKLSFKAKILAACPTCIYCGGIEPATTVEHMPPRIMFRRKDRPQGMEYGACSACNVGSKTADLVASLLGRMTLGDAFEGDAEDIEKLVNATADDIPGLHEELNSISSENHELVARLRAQGHQIGGPFQLGPISKRYLTAFCLKLGMAIHYEATGHPLPLQGNIYIDWYTNTNRLMGEMPDELLRFLPPGTTLKQGAKFYPDQFEYAYSTLSDSPMTISFSTFRFAFSMLAITADRSELIQPPAPLKTYSPADVAHILKSLMPTRSGVPHVNDVN